MGETERNEHARLQRRTDELKQEHAGLSLDVHPFDQAEHDAHNVHLREHKADLRRHQARKAE